MISKLLGYFDVGPDARKMNEKGSPLATKISMEDQK